MKHAKHIITVITICLILMTIILYYRQKPHKEQFTDGLTLVPPVEDHQRDRFATERCNALYTTDESLSEHATATMTAYIGGHRLQRWKPHRDDPAKRETTNDKDYCYFYGDDIALQSGKCDMTNPLFKDPEGIITGAFESEYADQTHTIPIRKCVLEIDRTTASTPQKLDKLWTHMGHFNCDQVTQSIRRDIESTRSQTNTVRSDHESLLTQYRANSNLASMREYELGQCTRSNIDYSQEYPGLVSQFMTLTERLRQERAAVEQQARDYATLQNDALTMHMQVNDARRDHNDMKLQASTCMSNLKKCETSKETHLFNYNIMQTANIDLRDNNLVLAEDLYGWTASYFTACNLVQTCSNDVAVQRGLYANYDRHWTASNAMYVTCQSQRATYSNYTTTYMNQFESYSNQLAKCRDDLFENGKILVVEQEELAACRARVAFLQKTIAETQARIKSTVNQTNTINKETQQVQTYFTTCQSDLGILESTVGELEKRRDAMLRELEALNAAANAASQESYNGQLEIIQKTVETTQRAAELACQAVSTRASGLRDQITEIKAAQIEAAGMPKINMTAACPSSCTPSRKQCIIYKNVYCRMSIADYRNQTTLTVVYTDQRSGDPKVKLLLDIKSVNENGFPADPPEDSMQVLATGLWHGIFLEYTFGNDQVIENWTEKSDTVEHFVPLLALAALGAKKKKPHWVNQPIAVIINPAFSVSKEVTIKATSVCDDSGMKGFLDTSVGTRRHTLLQHKNEDVHEHTFTPGVTYQFIFVAINHKSEGYLHFKDDVGMEELADVLLPPTTTVGVIDWRGK
jgi:hypothetical protein